MRASRTFVVATLLLAVSLVAGFAAVARRRLVGDGAGAARSSPLDVTLERAADLLKKGDFAAAEPLLTTALSAAERRQDDRAIATALNDIGHLQWGRGAYAAASATELRALELRRHLGDVAGQARLLNDIGLDLYSMGRYDEALARYTEALALDKAQPSPHLEGLLLANIGLVYRYEGRYDEAIRYFQESLRIRRQVGDPAEIGQTLNHLGMTSRAQGEYTRSLEYYGESLALRRKGGDRQGEAQTLNNMGNVYLDLGETDRAIEAYRESASIAETIGYRAQIGFSNENLGTALLQLRRPREAEARYQAALKEWRALGRRSQLTETLEELAELYLFGLDEASAARPLAEEALEIARKIDEPEAEGSALESLGTIEQRAGRSRAALERFDAARAISLRLGNPNLEYRARTGRALALDDLGRTDDAIAELRTSARIVNELRAKLTSDAEKIGLMDRRREVFEELTALLSRSGRSGEALEAAEAGRARAFADLLGSREVLTRLRSDDRELASLVDVASPSLAEIRGVADRLHATIVEYFITNDRLLTWVIDRRGRMHFASIPIGRDRVTALVKQARDAISRDQLEGADPATPALRALGRILIDPLAGWLPSSSDETVVIVPDGPLALVPFAALIDAGGRPLIERHALASAPAVSLFRYMTTAVGRAGATQALVVADPTPPHDSSAVALPGARDEARRVAERLGDANVRLLVGAQATEAAVKREVESPRLVHFATHGVISPDRPLASALLLGEGAGEDGYLRADEVFRLRLRAALVVLSGCSTGLGRTSGDGVLGLTRAFIYAGAASVMVSQWDVSDRATVMLVDRFYAELQAGRTKAQALQRAELATRAVYPHAALWAAFVLIGEPA